jgi:hypothetical protein
MNADVAIPALLDSVHLAIDVALDSIPMNARLGCGVPDRDSIRAASIHAMTPVSAEVRFHLHVSTRVTGAESKAHSYGALH